MIEECTTEEDFSEYRSTHCFYSKIKNKILIHDINLECEGFTCDKGLKMACEQINQNINLVELHLSILNEDAIRIYTQIQDTYIFENVHNDRYFEGAIDHSWDELLRIQKDIQSICQKGQYGTLNLE